MNKLLISTRADRWLWAARFFKTRAAATTAIRSGKVLLNNSRTKPSKLIRSGDELYIFKKYTSHRVKVVEIIEKRVSFQIASESYTVLMLSDSNIRNTKIKFGSLTSSPSPLKKPDKRARRKLMSLNHINHNDK